MQGRFIAKELGYNIFATTFHNELGCNKCKNKRRKSGLESIYHVHVLGQICPVGDPPTGLNCQLTSDGNIICSDNNVYSKDCPKAPTVNYPGVAEDVLINGTLAPKAPPAPGTQDTLVDTGIDTKTALAIGGVLATVLGGLYIVFR